MLDRRDALKHMCLLPLPVAGAVAEASVTLVETQDGKACEFEVETGVIPLSPEQLVAMVAECDKRMIAGVPYAATPLLWNLVHSIRAGDTSRFSQFVSAIWVANTKSDRMLAQTSLRECGCQFVDALDLDALCRLSYSDRRMSQRCVTPRVTVDVEIMRGPDVGCIALELVAELLHELNTAVRGSDAVQIGPLRIFAEVRGYGLEFFGWVNWTAAASGV